MHLSTIRHSTCRPCAHSLAQESLHTPRSQAAASNVACKTAFGPRISPAQRLVVRRIPPPDAHRSRAPELVHADALPISCMPWQTHISIPHGMHDVRRTRTGPARGRRWRTLPPPHPRRGRPCRRAASGPPAHRAPPRPRAACLNRAPSGTAHCNPCKRMTTWPCRARVLQSWHGGERRRQIVCRAPLWLMLFLSWPVMPRPTILRFCPACRPKQSPCKVLRHDGARLCSMGPSSSGCHKLLSRSSRSTPAKLTAQDPVTSFLVPG